MLHVEQATRELQASGWGAPENSDDLAQAAKHTSAAEEAALAAARAATQAAQTEAASLRRALAAEKAARQAAEARAAVEPKPSPLHLHTPRSNGSSALPSPQSQEETDAVCAQVARELKREADRAVRAATAGAAAAIAKAERDVLEARDEAAAARAQVTEAEAARAMAAAAAAAAEEARDVAEAARAEAEATLAAALKRALDAEKDRWLKMLSKGALKPDRKSRFETIATATGYGGEDDSVFVAPCAKIERDSQFQY